MSLVQPDELSGLLHDRAALLAHELLHIIRAAGAFAGAPTPLPAAERVHAGPRAGRGAAAAIRVGDAGKKKNIMHIDGKARQQIRATGRIVIQRRSFAVITIMPF